MADSYRVNQYVKGAHRDHNASRELLMQYDRWPTWMWGNEEVAELITWLNAENQMRTLRKKPDSSASTFIVYGNPCLK